MAVAARVLERVDADDHSVAVGERVAASGDATVDPLGALGLEALQRDGEAGPDLTLELLAIDDRPRLGVPHERGGGMPRGRRTPGAAWSARMPTMDRLNGARHGDEVA